MDRNGRASERMPSETVRFERVARRDPVPVVICVVLVALVAVSIAKPWQAPGPAGPERTGPQLTARTSPIAVATPFAVPIVAVDDAASFTSAWWVTVVENAGAHALRTWYRVEPVAADAAPDPSIPTLRIPATAPWALGFCVDEIDASRRVESVRAWSLGEDGRMLPVPLRAIALAPPIDCDRGAQFAPPPAPMAGENAWAHGRYVFDVHLSAPNAGSHRFAIDLVPASDRF